jgi:hypothetical protein
MADVTISTTIPSSAVPILQTALNHYNQANGVVLTPKQAVALAIYEWAWPHAAAAETEPINAQATMDMDAARESARVELEKII